MTDLPEDFCQLLFYRGRVALYAMLKGLGVGKGDDVALQAFTCLANPEAIIAAGAKPVYVDVEENGYNMNPADLNDKITAKTKAIIVQHTFGIPADIEHIKGISEERDIPVIEDCCHTLNSTYNGQRVGTFGAGAFYSYEWGKPIVVGIGGSALIHHQSLREKVEKEYGNFKEPPYMIYIRLRLQHIAHSI